MVRICRASRELEIGVIGVPLVMTIAMTIDTSDRMQRARRVCFVWCRRFAAAAQGADA
jgi:hypothetical protein